MLFSANIKNAKSYNAPKWKLHGVIIKKIIAREEPTLAIIRRRKLHETFNKILRKYIFINKNLKKKIIYFIYNILSYESLSLVLYFKSSLHINI